MPAKDLAQLIDIIKGSNVRDTRYREAHRALVGMGPAAVEALKAVLKDRDPVAASRAAEILREIQQRTD